MPQTPPDRWGDKRSARVGELFDLLANAPEGLTIEQIAEGLGVEIMTASGVVRDFRLSFHDDEINLVSDPHGHRQRWLYKLVATFDQARPWLLVRRLRSRRAKNTRDLCGLLSSSSVFTIANAEQVD